MTGTAESEAAGDGLAAVPPGAPPPAAPSAVSWAADVISRRREASIAFVAVVLFAYFWITVDAFGTEANLRVVTQFTSSVAILAVAQVMNLVAGEIDLSLGHVYALAPLLMWKATDWGWPLPLAIVFGLAGAALRRPHQRGDHRDDRGAVVHHHAGHAVLPPGVQRAALRGLSRSRRRRAPWPTGSAAPTTPVSCGPWCSRCSPHRADQHAVGGLHGRHRRQPGRRSRGRCADQADQGRQLHARGDARRVQRDQRGDPHRLDSTRWRAARS